MLPRDHIKLISGSANGRFAETAVIIASKEGKWNTTGIGCGYIKGVMRSAIKAKPSPPDNKATIINDVSYDLPDDGENYLEGEIIRSVKRET